MQHRTTLRALVVGTALAGVLVLAAGMAVATGGIPGADGTISACYPKNGALRVVAEGEACKKGESGLAWNQQGEQGPAGPMFTVYEVHEQALVAPGAWTVVSAYCEPGDRTLSSGHGGWSHQSADHADYTLHYILRDVFHAEGWSASVANNDTGTALAFSLVAYCAAVS